MPSTKPLKPEPKPIFPWQIAAAAQYAIGLAGFLLPFGFDKASRMGLDFSHFLVLAGLFSVVTLLGLIATVTQRVKGGFLVVLIGFPIFFVLVALRH